MLVPDPIPEDPANAPPDPWAGRPYNRRDWALALVLAAYFGSIGAFVIGAISTSYSPITIQSIILVLVVAPIFGIFFSLPAFPIVALFVAWPLSYAMRFNITAARSLILGAGFGVVIFLLVKCATLIFDLPSKASHYLFIAVTLLSNSATMPYFVASCGLFGVLIQRIIGPGKIQRVP